MSWGSLDPRDPVAIVAEELRRGIWNPMESHGGLHGVPWDRVAALRSQCL